MRNFIGRLLNNLKNSCSKTKVSNSILTSWILFYLHICGIKQGSLTIFHIAHTTCVLVLILISSLSGFILFVNEFDNFSFKTVEVVIYLLVCVHSCFFYSVLIIRRKQVYSIIAAMEGRFRSADALLVGLTDHYTILDREDIKSYLIMRSGSALSYVGGCILILSSLFSSNRKLLYPLWLPVSLDHDEYYFPCVVLQLGVGMMVFSTLFSCCGLCVGGAHFLGGSLEALGHAVCNVFETVKANELKLFCSLDQMIVEEKLKKCVNINMEILRIIKDYKALFDIMILEIVTMSEVMICFVGFQFILATKTLEAKIMLQYSCYFLIFVAHLLMFCYSGQYLYNKSEEFQNAIYFSCWEDQSLKCKKMTLVILTGIGNPVYVTAAGIVKATLATYLKALRTAYSYISLLLTLKRTTT